LDTSKTDAAQLPAVDDTRTTATTSHATSMEAARDEQSNATTTIARPPQRHKRPPKKKKGHKGESHPELEDADPSLGVALSEPFEPALDLDWAEMEADEASRLQATTIFSMGSLPCNIRADKINFTANPEQGPRVAVFGYRKLSGATFMRAHTLAAAVSEIPGWQGAIATSGDSKLTFPPGARFELCVLVKGESPLWQWCKRNHAKWLLLDVLDTVSLLRPFTLGGGLGVVDMLLSPNEFLANLSRTFNPINNSGHRAGLPRATTLYHQHSNVGYMSDIRRARLPYVCRVAVHFSSKYHSSRPESFKRVWGKVCQSRRVWTYSAYVTYGTEHPHGLKDYPCPGRSQEMTKACQELDADSIKRRTGDCRVAAEGCFANQGYHHNKTGHDMIDVVIVLPELSGLIQRLRPSTRFLHWASHGVPVIFWDFYAYMDITVAGNYTLPSGELPHINTDYWREGSWIR